MSSIEDFIKQSPICQESANNLANLADVSLCNISKYSASVFSKNGEDGIVYFILSKIGISGRNCIEIGHDAVHSVCANLILNNRFIAFNITADTTKVLKPSINFDYDTNIYSMGRLRYIYARVTCRNVINKLLLLCKNAIPHEVDVFVINMKGNDYWILKTLLESNVVSPRVIVVSYQDILGPERAVTIPYDENFSYLDYDNWNGANYCGASLQAFIRLLKDDYAFVGCEKRGFTGFFVKRSLCGDGLEELVDVKECFEIESVKFGMEHRFPRVSNLEWTCV